MTQRLAVPVGMVQLAFYDDRRNSSSFGNVYELETGERNFCLVIIPPKIWYGFKGISTVPALIANCTDIHHDPTESEGLDPFDKRIPFSF